MLIPHRFCEAATPNMLERGAKNGAPLAYLKHCVKGLFFLHNIIKTNLCIDYHRGVNVIPIDICKLIGNSDLLEKTYDDTIAVEKNAS